MSKWKAGQCVTIENKRHRIARHCNYRDPCPFCAFKDEDANRYPCNECMDDSPKLIPYYCYFKEIKPKS